MHKEENRVEFRLHEKQREAWDKLWKEKREVALISGVQGGKTIFGSFAMREAIQTLTHPGNSFFIGAPTYKIMNQSTLPTFAKIHSKYIGSYNGKDECFTLKDGRKVWFRTSTDPDSIEGIPDCVFGWIDEAGKCNRRFWVNAQARLARRQGKLLLTTTWYALNWLYKEIWKPFADGTREDLHVTSFNSAENPSFPNDELERHRGILSPAEFQRKYLGEPGRMEGMVFESFNDDNWCDPFRIGSDVPVYGGVDWGFDHPMAVTIRAFPSDKRCYTISIFKKSGLSVSQALDLIQAKHKLYGVKMFYCGHDRPDMISELNARGVPATNYFSGNTDYREVNVGNQKLAELIRTNQYQVFKGVDHAEDLEDEFLSYVWKRSGDYDYTEKEKPININDDIIAAERYCTVGTLGLMKEKVVEYKVPLNLVHRIDTWTPEDADRPDSWDEY